ncbi:MAG: alpha/beta fold hydrolase [Verrucomicrobia bacterium]|nr:alpha/beta fold hydrolase [Verrucomicrobiota bacterium]
MVRTYMRLVLCILAVFAISGCAPNSFLVSNPKANSGESDTFGYRTWKRKGVEPDVVIIGIHGFCGASVDYTNLGEHLVKKQKYTAVYAYEVRGQGSDPIHERRGDIGDPQQWYADLEAFTQLVEERHPDAKIIWYGESMGALIATHAICSAPSGKSPCDGLVLSSPIVRFKDDIEPWKIALVRAAATTLPLARVSLDALAGQQDVQMTQESYHAHQSKTNDYNVEQHTLRLLGTLANLIDGMNGCAEKLEVPTLVLHGGKDYFNNDSDVRGFVARIPTGIPSTYRDYPEAFHLLMYDEKREKIFRDVEKWLNRQR